MLPKKKLTPPTPQKKKKKNHEDVLLTIVGIRLDNGARLSRYIHKHDGLGLGRVEAPHVWSFVLTLQ